MMVTRCANWGEGGRGGGAKGGRSGTKENPKGKLVRVIKSGVLVTSVHDVPRPREERLPPFFLGKIKTKTKIVYEPCVEARSHVSCSVNGRKIRG